jgi:bifunctional DNA-binding transcriptional regulator/antitoxin component of YhaV-PrlF toxin-antitoxin module
MSAKVQLTTRGRITISRAMRERLGLPAGGSVDWTITPDGILMKAAKDELRAADNIPA